MNVAIVGSRNYPDLSAVQFLINSLPDRTVIVSGGARGVDAYAMHCAKTRGFPTKIFYPDWQKYGKSAGILRNIEIIKMADQVHAFWDGVSKGTSHSIELAKKYNKDLIIYLHSL